MRRRRLCVAALAVVVPSLQIGCAFTPPPPIELAPKAALFPRAPDAADLKTPGRVALLVPPEVQATGTNIPPLAMHRLQTGPMVGQALLLALGDGLQGGAQLAAALPPAGGGFDATLEMRWVQLQFRNHPIPPQTIALTFNVRLIDAQGRTAWTRIYHDDKDYPMSERLFLVRAGEQQLDALQRLAHEAAWRLSQQVLHDLREWLAEERMRPREL